jgi:carbamoyl-phosphate synthase large subunit
MSELSKILVIGSGPIIIGQAAEFDYAGTQALRALREEGITSVLVNSNPATIMTDEGIADIVYIEPLTPDVLTRIIQKEKPDGILPTLGGQTGLNLAVELAQIGILDKYGVRLLGTPLETIKMAEERSQFKNLLLRIKEPVPRSTIVHSVEEAETKAPDIGFPLIIRPSYTLGGSGGGMAQNPLELREMVRVGLSSSLTREVLLEESLLGWKEIEYEVIRDGADNCIIVCNMENFDPMGVHTGDSIVVAPSQTLTDKEYQMLRSASINIIRALRIEGGCNIQFALSPWAAKKDHAESYYVIEVNPRVSRSSALASKATGYPIARVATKIAVGKRLDEIGNQVTGKTTAAFEPALDYCVVKIPRFPFDKFPLGDRVIGSQMKATGEVMAIDRCFEAALQKAVRSLEIGRRSLLWEDKAWGEDISSYPLYPSDFRLWVIMAALRRGAQVVSLSLKTGIDPWFIHRMMSIVDMEQRFLSEPLTPEILGEGKRLGFSDDQIATLADRLPEQVRNLRHEWNILPVYKMVDTCAGEFEAETPYFYSTYEEENEAPPLPERKAIVIGSGPIRIGQGIEFDYCSVHTAWALKGAEVKSIMVNSNPETVSTDFDTSDRLYFEALDEESIRDILENETFSSPPPSIVQFGGQTAINLTDPLYRSGMPIMGSDAQTIDMAEDRELFEGFLRLQDIPQPPGGTATTIDEALKVAHTIGYPVLVRPSYVLGGRAMEIVYTDSELINYIQEALDLGTKHPVLIDKYLQGKEAEVDAVSDGQGVLIPGIMEHIERAGVHSGDSMACYPPLSLTPEETEKIVDYTVRIARHLHIRGLMNVQFVIMPQSKVYVLEVNPRASRTVPFISKLTGVPLVKIAILVMLGKSLPEQGYTGGLWKVRNLWGIKAPVFSMGKLPGVDTYLSPEMKSTGEVMGVDYTFAGALAKALIASDFMLSLKSSILLSIADRDKVEALPIIRELFSSGYMLYATRGTAEMIKDKGMEVKAVAKKLTEGYPNVVDVIQERKVDAVVNTTTGERTPLKDGFEIRRAASERRIPCFTSLDTIKVAVEALAYKQRIFSVQPLRNYVEGG